MGSEPAGVQYPLTSSLGEFLGYWDWLLYPGLSSVLVSIAFPFSFPILGVLSINSSGPTIGFHSSIFHGAVSAPRNQPSSFTRAWDQYRVTVEELAFFTETSR